MLQRGNNLGVTVASAYEAPQSHRGKVSYLEWRSCYRRLVTESHGGRQAFVLMKCLLSASLSNDMEESAASDTSTCHQRVNDQRERARERTEEGGGRLRPYNLDLS